VSRFAQRCEWKASRLEGKETREGCRAGKIHCLPGMFIPPYASLEGTSMNNAHQSSTTEAQEPQSPRILLVDNDEQILSSLRDVLEINQFQVTTACNVTAALHLIDTQAFDLLLSDLHMPGAADGFTLVSAMRHVNPKAATLVFTGYPALAEAMDTILLQADQVLVKPMPTAALIAAIRENLLKAGNRVSTNTERVATILERDIPVTVADWLARVNTETELTCLPLPPEQRTAYLPKLLKEVIHRLRVPRKLGSKQVSEAAVEHGKTRHSQGYTLPMIIEESRILQVSIFDTLQKNLTTVDFSLLLTDVMTIADECDSQLKQAVISFTAQAAVATVSASA
jgi:DNA-binding response OmpR family regulator